MPDIFDQISLEEETPRGDIFDEIITQKPSFPEEVGRHTARTASRIGESLVGLPGDIGRLLQTGAEAVGAQAAKVREKIGLEPLKERKAPPGLPGSGELRDLSTKIFGEKVVPQSKTETFIDEIVSDAALLAIPVKGKIPFLRAIGTALAGNIASTGAEKVGFGEKGQAAAKIGTFFLSGLVGKGNVKKYWNEQYKLADEAVPSRAYLDANKLDMQLDKLLGELRKGGIETPSQKFVQKPVKELKRITQYGEMKVEDAIAAKKKINELRSSLFEDVKGAGARKHARTKINDVAKFVDESLENYGKENPVFFKHYKNANEAYAGFQQSKRVGNWISRAIPFGKIGKGGLLILEAIFKPATLKATIPGVAVFKTGELVTRMFKNPTLRRFYGNLIKDAINENKGAFVKNLRGMEKEIEKSDPDIFDEIYQSS